MSQTAITLAFERWKAQQGATGEPVLLDEFVFANVPGLNPDTPIDRNEVLPPAAQIVHRQPVTRSGVVNENSVVFSAVLGADVGDFVFNWIGLLNKASGTLAMIVHAPEQQKLKTAEGQQGNVLTRSFLMEYNGAQTETAITTPAETWQIDFTARMTGMDERQRVENLDIFGSAAFFGDGYLVAKSGSQFFVTKGTGYVGGLRASLEANQNIAVAAKPVKVWLDVCWTGSLTSVWGVQTKITLATDLANYLQNGVQHYVFALASIDANGNITDLRPKGTLNEQAASDALKKHEQSRNHPDATTGAKGFVQLSSATDSTSEALAATPKALKIAMDNANARLAKDRNGADIPNPALFIQNIGLQQTVDLAKGAVPSTRRVNGKALSGDIEIFPSDIYAGSVALGAGVDLNAITTPGLYYQPQNVNAQGGKNYPEVNAGSLEVLKHAGVTQIYRIYNNSKCYWRALYGNNWSAWAKVYDNNFRPTAAEVGALPSSGTAVAAVKLATPRLINGIAFDGTQNIGISATAVGAYSKAESDAKYGAKNTIGKAANGWFKDTTTGLIIQWGFTNQTGGYQNITFPIAFPNACRNIQVTPYTANVAGTLECSVSQYSNTTARLNANQNYPLFWQATGY
ncbi:hypothetical protein D9F79_09005 [Escherichia coli]|jgi:hypothetical protein|uniref:phage tail-collar fiber domain-containing protein n=3 Tax=Escherichia coli TaxID=562 RepID=UPI0006A60CB6|nr:phage tail protein [Escherichia coli]DAV50620.1 MAG TPA: Tail fiber protein [Caudoviricetes sp.]EEW1868090.1 hypothetical protein [Escherichia coli]EHW7196816.1 phage tail protein [Escherichia coli]BEA72131.1 hypothetical protein VEE01_12920 [Escherichia coli]HAW0175327.1 hypothetical protein [Escherichia coli]